MKEKLYCLLSFFAVSIVVVGCPSMGLFYEEDLGNGYTVRAADMKEQIKIVRKGKEGSASTIVVQPMVFAYGWNDDFILAKRHPVTGPYYTEVDTGLTYWYIVEVASGNVHGPLSEGEFNELRTKLKVPAKISFKTIQ